MTLQNASSPIIRDATERDIPKLIDLSASAPAAAQWSDQQYHQALGGDPERCKAFVVERDSQILGFLIARGIDMEWEIENIVISEFEQRKGWGSELLKQLVKALGLNNTNRIFLEVRESNLAARSFYQKWGFHPTGRRPGYYSDPVEDALIYHLSFGHS